MTAFDRPYRDGIVDGRPGRHVRTTGPQTGPQAGRQPGPAARSTGRELAPGPAARLDTALQLASLRSEFPAFGILADPRTGVWTAVRGRHQLIRAPGAAALRERLLATTRPEDPPPATR